MTREEFAKVMENGLVEKVANVLKRSFRYQTPDLANENTQSAVMVAASQVDKFNSPEHVTAFITTTAKNIAMRKFTQEIEHRRILGQFPAIYHKRDPQAKLDFEIDLEAAILKNVRYFPMQKACWKVLVEGNTVDEVIPYLSSDRSVATWKNRLRECLKNVRECMRRGGYMKMVRV